MSEIDRTSKWFVTAGQMPADPTPDPRQVAFYIGMQLEELGEKVAAVLGASAGAAKDLRRIGTCFKTGSWDDKVQLALADPKYAEELLDGDMDLLWVTIGAARAQGADAEGAFQAVADANWDKFRDGVKRDPTTGKVLKPAGWAPPNLAEFLHPTLRSK